MPQLTIQQALDLALQHHQAGRLREAEALYRQILAQQPTHVDALHLLGILAHHAGRSDIAVDLIRRAIAGNPALAHFHGNLGIALKHLGQLEEAIATYRRAIALKPDFAEAHANLGNALRDAGRVDEAIAAYRQAIALKPEYAEAHSNLIYSLHFPWAGDTGTMAESIAEEHRRWSRQHAAAPRRFIQPHKNDRDPNRRLRIGYVSGDFRSHSVSRFLLPLFRHHDHAACEIICYCDVVKEDEVTSSLRTCADQWHKIVGRTDEAVAEKVRQDKIDILVDLAGHTAGNRLRVFARKPAPVQVAFLGYPGTTGLPEIDYRLTDAVADPPGRTESLHSEKLWRLPTCAWCYDEPKEAPPIRPSRADGPICFGTFNNFAKASPAVMELWAQILIATPSSRLVLKSRGLGEAGIRRQIREFFESRGVQANRLEIRGLEPSVTSHLDVYNQLDIALDTFPYHGTTTTCEALWMGVPVVTLAGESHVSRVGVSLLSAVGLPELIAQSPQEYVSIAVGLAADLPRLTQLRRTLRARMTASPLMDGPRFARDIEAAYRRMWQTWCKDGAIDALRQAVARRPDSAEAHSRLGIALIEQGQIDAALAAFRQAIAVKPQYAESHSNLGNALREAGELDAAIAAYRQAILLDPASAEAHSNLGNALKDIGQVDEAIHAFRRAIALQPDFTPAHYNLALALLYSDLPEGWREYEWRWKFQGSQSPHSGSSGPLWDGGDLKNRTILVHHEQGLGDTIHFARYIPMLAERGAKVIFECQSELKSLLQNLSGAAQVIAAGEKPPEFDCHVPLLSLPLHFQTTLKNIPAAVPYLRPDGHRVEAWRRRFAGAAGLKVGLVWAGSPLHRSDRQRSMAPELLSPLPAVKGVTFFSLQKPPGPRMPPGIVNLSDDLHDFCDTAAALSQLDLLISVDTAAAHLAGALGRPVWVMLQFMPDWRWLLHRDDTPWYPTMRLFRQRNRGDWAEVIGRVAAALAALAPGAI